MNTPILLRETTRGSLTAQAAPGQAEPFQFVSRRGDACHTPGFHHCAKLTAGAWWHRKQGVAPGYSLRFEDHWTGDPIQFSLWQSRTAEPPAGTHQASVHRNLVRGAEVSGAALEAWLHTPAERAADYLQWFAQVSFDLQASLRRWLPYLLLREPVILNDPELRASLLFYAASRPYFARVRGLFTWDVICPDSMACVYRSGAQGLPAILTKAQRYVAASSLGQEAKQELLTALAPSETRTILIRVRRDPRALKSLLTLEGKLVESLLALGGKGRDLAREEETPKNLHRFCAEWAHGVQTKLRRALGAVALPNLVDLALVESTTSLAQCAGLPMDRKIITNDRAELALGNNHDEPAQAA